jgi:opacity protein-like surface antigen
MRANLMVSVLGCALAGAITASTAAIADWHSPYFYRETNGSWTNVTYDDGICRYRYSHNAYDYQTYLNKYGDCSRIAVGPDGLATPIPMYGARVVYRAPVARGRIMYGQE